jgi:hypothetical protein
MVNQWKSFAMGVMLLTAWAWAQPVKAMTLNLTYDTSVTSLGAPLSAEIESAVNAAAQTLQNLYTNPITVNITVYWGATGPFSGGIGLGESSYVLVGNPTYSQLTNALRSARTTPADTNAVASLPAANPIGNSVWWVPRAEAKALNYTSSGTVSQNDTNHDGDIGFASNFTYTFSPTNRAVVGQYDLIGIAEHEITEVLGRGEGLNRFIGGGGYVPYDLFRFTNSGARSLNPNDTGVYFSVNNGVTVLKYFNPISNGGDLQDWQTSNPADSYDASTSTGEEGFLSYADLIAVDIIGYDLHFAVPRLKGVNLGNGVFQLSFTNTPGLNFSILASTNIAVSVTNWTVLGMPTENPAGQYQFTDSVTNNVQFYRVRLN